MILTSSIEPFPVAIPEIETGSFASMLQMMVYTNQIELVQA